MSLQMTTPGGKGSLVMVQPPDLSLTSGGRGSITARAIAFDGKPTALKARILTRIEYPLNLAPRS